jgi:hypothetical protein
MRFFIAAQEVTTIVHSLCAMALTKTEHVIHAIQISVENFFHANQTP